MNLRNHVTLLGALLAAAMLTACPGKVPGIPGGSSGKVDPNTCGNYAVTDAGRKLKAFLTATSNLEVRVTETAKVVKQSCVIMGEKLQMASTELNGETDVVCARVITRIQDNLKVGLKANASLKVEYKPAVCKVDIRASARAAAECEGKAEADIKATCEGRCDGTCSGGCDGKAGTGGNSGKCDGVCKGTCEGSCEGSAKVDASASCRAQAEVDASLNVECSEPEFKVEAEASAVVDTSKIELTLSALREGMPKIFSVQARLKPLQAAVATWATSAGELAASANDLAASFKDQALCISGQIAAAASMVTNIKASVSVSVEVSASASGTVGR
jgi:modification target Cys-rich repeat protein